MDLFIVNRYLGDEGSGNKESDEKAKLETLLSKIEQRRKQRQAEQISKEETVTPKEITNNVDESPYVTSSKKRGLEKFDPYEEQNEEAIAEVKNKKRNTSEIEGFTVLGKSKFKKMPEAKPVLPNWLSNPTLVSMDLQNLTTTVDSFPGLDKDIVKKLKSQNITHFFPVQTQVIPFLLAAERRRQYWPPDICVSAPTGSGKTLAFVLPIVQVLRSRVVMKVRALVILPVQDLASQVYQVFLTYTKFMDLKVALLTGNKPFEQEQKQLVSQGAVSGYRSLVDIIVSTPGRLVDHLKTTPGFSLKHLRFLVIDEADRVIDKVNNSWLHHVNTHINPDSKGSYYAPPLTISTLESTPTPPPQKLLFSATLTQDPEKLQEVGLFQPKLFMTVGDVKSECTDSNEVKRGDFVGTYIIPAEVSEYICEVKEEIKPLVLYHLIASNGWKHVLVFVGSSMDAHRLSLLLTCLGKNNLKVAEISSSLLRRKRHKTLEKFASGEIDIIVSTDALARGIDFECVDYVISYSLPRNIEQYIHRVGRTGRAGREGSAVTLVREGKVRFFKKMRSVAGNNDSLQDLVVQESDLEDKEEDYKTALQQLKSNLKEEVILEKKRKPQKKIQLPKRRINKNKMRKC